MDSNIPEWNNDAAGLLKQFLNSAAGKAFLGHLAQFRPSLKPGVADINARAIAAAEVSGFEHCFSTVSQLSEPVVKKPNAESPTAYPPLEDETAWNK